MDNPQAFPISRVVQAGSFRKDESDPGMTLRDYFAAAALPACHEAALSPARTASVSGREFCKIIATAAYEIADAMLAERERES